MVKAPSSIPTCASIRSWLPTAAGQRCATELPVAHSNPLRQQPMEVVAKDLRPVVSRDKVAVGAQGFQGVLVGHGLADHRVVGAPAEAVRSVRLVQLADNAGAIRVRILVGYGGDVVEAGHFDEDIGLLGGAQNLSK